MSVILRKYATAEIDHMEKELDSISVRYSAFNRKNKLLPNDISGYIAQNHPSMRLLHFNEWIICNYCQLKGWLTLFLTRNSNLVCKLHITRMHCICIVPSSIHNLYTLTLRRVLKVLLGVWNKKNKSFWKKTSIFGMNFNNNNNNTNVVWCGNMWINKSPYGMECTSEHIVHEHKNLLITTIIHLFNILTKNNNIIRTSSGLQYK